MKEQNKQKTSTLWFCYGLVMVMLLTPVKVPTVIFDLHRNLEMRSSSKVITKKPAPRLWQLTSDKANDDSDKDDQHASNHAVPDIRDPVDVEYLLAKKRKKKKERNTDIRKSSIPWRVKCTFSYCWGWTKITFAAMKNVKGNVRGPQIRVLFM